MKIGNVSLPSPYVVAPMAGMTDTAFRRLVKRQGGCGLVVTEMVSWILYIVGSALVAPSYIPQL